MGDTTKRDAVLEARADVVMCYHPATFSEAEFNARLDAYAAAVRSAAVTECITAVEAFCDAVAAAYQEVDHA